MNFLRIKAKQVICPDLRGYGASEKPKSDARHYPYSKRAMAVFRLVYDYPPYTRVGSVTAPVYAQALRNGDSAGAEYWAISLCVALRSHPSPRGGAADYGVPRWSMISLENLVPRSAHFEYPSRLCRWAEVPAHPPPCG